MMRKYLPLYFCCLFFSLGFIQVEINSVAIADVKFTAHILIIFFPSMLSKVHGAGNYSSKPRVLPNHLVAGRWNFRLSFFWLPWALQSVRSIR